MHYFCFYYQNSLVYAAKNNNNNNKTLIHSKEKQNSFIHFTLLFLIKIQFL